MSKKELENQINELESQLFILECKDRFDDSDYDLQRSLNEQISKKRKILEGFK